MATGQCYFQNDPYRLWAGGNPVASFTDIEDALDWTMELVEAMVDPDDYVAAEGRHCVDGQPLLEFTMAGGGPLLCVLYGATWEQWKARAPEAVMAN